MKIKKLAKLCAARKSIWVYDGERLQYIGDGSACYTVRGLPELDEESLMVIFDVPEGKRGDYVFRRQPAPEGLNFEDGDDTENVVDRLPLEMGDIVMLKTSRGLAMIDKKYLEPIADEEQVELYERTGRDGEQYIVAKSGFELLAVIGRMRVTEGFALQVRELADLAEIAAEAEKVRDKAKEDAAAEEQIKMA